MEKIGLKSILLASTIAVSAPALAAQAPAESAQADAGDIVVTARRTNESLQKVPVAVSVLGGEDMSKNNIVDSYGILAQVPGLQNITRNQGNPSAVSFLKIRGVAPAAVYFNEAPVPAMQWGWYAPFFDLANVQVLKGPQGTLFGQASNAGAILNTPKRPGDDFSGYMKVSAGNYNFRSIEGAVDIPVIKDVLAVRLAGIDYHRDGYVRDSLSDRIVAGTMDYKVGRATIVFTPSDNIENVTLFQYELVKDFGGAGTSTPGDYSMVPNALNNTIAATNGMTLAQLIAARDQILANQRVIGPYRTQGWSNGCPASALAPATTSTVPGPNVSSVVPQPCPPGGGFFRDYELINTTTVHLGESFSLKNVFSHTWGKMTWFGLSDNDGTRIIGNELNPRNVSIVNPTPSGTSEELQVNGKFNNFDFVLGGFYYKETPTNVLGFGNYTTSISQSLTRSIIQTVSKSVYGQGNLDLSGVLPGLKVFAGARRTWDTARRQQFIYAPAAFPTLTQTGSNGGPGTATGEAHWQHTSYTVGAQYQITPDTMVYLNNSKGNSAGGLQNNNVLPKFDPDQLNNLEFGFKTIIRAGDTRIRVNGAAYYGWYNNVKVNTVQNLETAPGSGVFSLINSVDNAAQARIKGFELEVGANVGRLFELNGFVALQDPRYTHYRFFNSLANTTVDLVDQPFSQAPRWQLGFSPTFHVPVDEEKVGKIDIGLAINWRSKMWANPVKPVVPNDPNNPDTGLLCVVPRTAAYGYGPLSADGKKAYKGCAPAAGNINLNVNWENVLGNEGVSLGFTVTNLTANHAIYGLSSQYDTLNANQYQYNEPRMYHLTLGYKF
ncbi:TonB-dependent receptor [Sphingobium sp. EP60837]|uniref:TonB-dependent receptor n=1 Tax=Sphingobium sp. EP60837 TaxID=1855519 RepID=UPI0007DDA5FC|nr:TonB-dependent receptor [Sphingobium sp. EP60837]ANI80098.1 hypothetical protein EP837_03716 [Sphingobium sp. EP60837]